MLAGSISVDIVMTIDYTTVCNQWSWQALSPELPITARNHTPPMFPSYAPGQRTDLSGVQMRAVSSREHVMMLPCGQMPAATARTSAA